MQKLFFSLVLLCFSIHVFSQNTVGLIQSDAGQQNGYLLLSPNVGDSIYLIDKCGKKIHHWNSTHTNSIASYLHTNGNLYRLGYEANPAFGSSGGIMAHLEIFNWDNQLIWHHKILDSTHCLHHDFQVMPNGNILVNLWEKYSQAEAISMGKDTSGIPIELWTEKLLEIQPIGDSTANIVWEWNAFDHLIQDFDSTKLNYGVISEHPELIDFNYTGTITTPEDILHFNGLDYNAALDQIMITVRGFSEIWIIDHSTSTAAAASHTGGNCGKGGDLLYRWGNPQTYGRGNTSHKKLFEGHDGHWIQDSLPGGGHAVIFNNGVTRPISFSSVDEIILPINSSHNYDIDSILAFGPDSIYWSYTDPVPTSFYANRISGSQRLSNGNTIILHGPLGKFFEVDPSNQIVWEYINPMGLFGPFSQGSTPSLNLVFNVNFYDATYPGLTGHSLIPGMPVELNPSSIPVCYFTLNNEEFLMEDFILYPNPTNEFIYSTASQNLENSTFRISNMLGENILQGNGTDLLNGIDITYLPNGIYSFVFSNASNILNSIKFIKQ